MKIANYITSLIYGTKWSNNKIVKDLIANYEIIIAHQQN
jgi:hypothetical protein